jgi:DNA-binding SARP family transcriptional activator
MVDVSGGTPALASGVRVDVRDLTSGARGVLDTAADGDMVPLLDVRQSNELLPGWYDDWVLLEREHLPQLRLHSLHSLDALAGSFSRAGRYGETVETALAAVRSEPLRKTAPPGARAESPCGGNIAEALRAYELFPTLLLEEVAVAPTAEMQALISGLRRPQRVRALPAAHQRLPEAVGSSRPGRRP